MTRACFQRPYELEPRISLGMKAIGEGGAEIQSAPSFQVAGQVFHGGVGGRTYTCE